MKTQLEGKVSKLRKYGYVAFGIVKSALDILTIPKADGPVYNGVGSELNEAL